MTDKPNLQLLTNEELGVLAITADLANRIVRVIGDGPQASNDWNEAAVHIHSLQHMIMAQAAARAYPDTFRLLGQQL